MDTVINTTSGSSIFRRLWHNRWGISAGLIMFGASACLMAAENDSVSDAALQDLLQALDQETEIATKTRMNIDFVPGMVSVLYGDDLLARGIASVVEAMALIPGVELSLSSDGQSQVFVRGIGTAFSSGKTKVLLNGIPFNATLSVATTALRIPTEQVDRIEVIRGPGSAIYGEFAYSGVINIVTRKDSNRVFARYGDLGSTTVGGILAADDVGQDLSMSLSFSRTWIDGGGVKTGRDVLRNSFPAALSNAPGESNEKELDTSVIFQSKYRDSKFSVQFVKVDAGDYFGLAHALPSYGQKLMREVSFLTVSAETMFSLASDLDVTAFLGWHDYKLDSGLHELYPAGTFGVEPVIGSPNYEERKFRLGADLNYKGWDNHDVLAGVELLYTMQGDTYAERNYDSSISPPSPVLPLLKYRGADNWLEEDLTRFVFGAFVQDQFSISDRLTMTAGLRFDHYDDVGHALSPRIAAVYQLREHQTVKAQYAQAFRPPTFIETGTKNNPVVSGNPDIESERMTTYELAYVFNDEVNRFQATLFYADMHDLIVVDSASSYVNEGEVHSHGVELEYVRNFGRKLKVDVSTSYMRPWNETADVAIADVAMLTGNIGLVYHPKRNYSVAAQYRYVGEREREAIDVRDDLEGYQVVDITASSSNLFISGFTLRAGVKNLFNEEVVYPAPMVFFNGSLPAYEDDYPRPGREYWLQADVRF